MFYFLSFRVSQFLFNSLHICTLTAKASKVVPYSITSTGLGADPGFLAVSLRMTLVINPVVGCRSCPPGLQLLSQPKKSPPLVGSKLYCLETEAHGSKYLAQGHYAMVPSPNSNPQPVNHKSNDRIQLLLFILWIPIRLVKNLPDISQYCSEFSRS